MDGWREHIRGRSVSCCEWSRTDGADITATRELGILDTDGDGIADVVVNERGGEGALVSPTRITYRWRRDAFYRYPVGVVPAETKR